MKLNEFLHTVITSPTSPNTTWMKWLVRGSEVQWTPYPSVVEQLVELEGSADVYYSPHLSAHPNPNGLLLPTRTVAVDMNATDLIYLPATPSITVNTSPQRNQVYFIFDEEVDESIARQIATSVDEADIVSSTPGYLLRLPNTKNTKYSLTDPHPIHITNSTGDINKLENLIPSPNGIHIPDTTFEVPAMKNFRPVRFIEELDLPPLVTQEFSTATKTPEKSLRRLIVECLRRGVPKGVVFTLAKASANNYTSKLTYHQDEELRKLVAILETKKDDVDVKEEIYRIKTMSQTQEARQEGISRAIIKHMRNVGTFMHMTDNEVLYIPSGGQPIYISDKEQRLRNYLDIVFGLNASESDSSYTINSLLSFTSSLPAIGHGATLSYYDKHTQRILINTGAPRIYSITSTEIREIRNGSSNIVLFPLNDISLPFVPRDKALVDPHSNTTTHWSNMLFGPVLDRILGLEPEEARAILTTWFLFILFKNDAGARPLLGVLGQAGSGKSTLMKRICTLLYGKVSGFMSIGTRDEYDQVTSMYPLVVIDNLDTWQSWIPDSLAQSASAIDRGVRKLYTNNQLHIYHRDAIVAITAHDPKFSRPDVADRLLILPMKRIEDGQFIAERDLMRIDRPAMWFHIFRDLQKILATPQPPTTEQLRVQDFVSIGSWIADSLDLLPQFKSAINKLKGSQKAFALDAEQLLLTAVINYATKSRNPTAYKLPQTLYSELELYSGDGQAFQRKYKNAQVLNQKLWNSQDALRSVVDVSWAEDEFKRRTWRIVPMNKETS